MPPGPPPDEFRCTELTKMGTRCGKWALTGQDKCKWHTDKPDEVEAAEVEAAIEVAEALEVNVSTFGGDPFAALSDHVGRLQAKVELFDAKVTELTDRNALRYRSKTGSENMRAEWKMLMDSMQELRLTCDLILRAGVAERVTRIREAEQQTSELNAVAVFTFCMEIIRDDVQASLIDLGMYGQSPAVMEQLGKRLHRRLSREQEMITGQVEILARRDEPAGERKALPR